MPGRARILSATIVIALATYILLSKNNEWLPFMLLCLGVNTLLTGLIERGRKGKAFWGNMNIAVSFFVFIVSIVMLLSL